MTGEAIMTKNDNELNVIDTDAHIAVLQQALLFCADQLTLTEQKHSAMNSMRPLIRKVFDELSVNGVHNGNYELIHGQLSELRSYAGEIKDQQLFDVFDAIHNTPLIVALQDEYSHSNSDFIITFYGAFDLRWKGRCTLNLVDVYTSNRSISSN